MKNSNLEVEMMWIINGAAYQMMNKLLQLNMTILNLALLRQVICKKFLFSLDKTHF